MADQSELLQMMMDDAPAALPTDAPQAADSQNPVDEPSGAAPAQMDLTPAAVVQSTDLDKPAKQQGAAKKRQLKKAQDRDDKEREEAIRAVLGGDDEESEDPKDTDDKEKDKKKKKKPAAGNKGRGSVTKSGLEKTKKEAASASATASAKSTGEESKKKKQQKQQPKKKSDEEEGSTTPGTVRRQAGHAMIKAEYDRITRALDALVRKRVQREESNGGQAPTSVCGILINNLIEFYEQDVLVPFDRKFARYMN